jgi:hypothetical protein
MVNEPNRLEDEEYIVQLIGKVVTVSVENGENYLEIREFFLIKNMSCGMLFNTKFLI